MDNFIFCAVQLLTLLLPQSSLKKKAILPPHLPSPVILKEELTDLFWKLLGISYPYRQIASSYITKLC